MREMRQMTITPEMSVEQIEEAIASHARVDFAPGDYCLDRPIRLNGLNGRALRGAPGACLTGGKRVRVAWTPDREGVWRTKLDDERPLDGLRLGIASFRQARYPHASQPDQIYEGTMEDALDFAARSAHPEEGYFHALHAHLWGDAHYVIDGRRQDGSLSLTGGWQNNRPMGEHPRYRFVENLFEALGAEGEFFYDRRAGELYVCAACEPAEEALLIRNPYLLDIRACRNIQIEGLTFTDSARTFMANYEPLLRSDWRIHRGGAVFVENSANVEIENCAFRRVGSNALFFSGNVEDCRVERCHIHDVGASGVCFVGQPSSVRFPCMDVDATSFSPEDLMGVGPKTDEYVRDCSVENCLIHDVGRTEKQTACVEISMSARVRVSHCTMYACPRAAVNISEGTFGGHVIEYNDIFDTVRETGDHGSFNGWGRDRFWHAEGLTAAQMKSLALRDAVETTVIRGNRIRCDHGWDIDLDDGCSNYLVEDNLCLSGGLKFREGFCRTARRNRIINNTFHPHVWFEDSGDVFEDNLVMRPYLPIGMPKTWGERMDRNILVTAGGTPCHAVALQQLSGQDAASIAMPVSFDENLCPVDPDLAARFPETEPYGVTDEALRARARPCPVDAPNPAPAWQGSEGVHIGDGLFKSIETEGEMSAFASSGHHGVIVLALPPYSDWYAAGLRENMAIIAANGQMIEDASHFQRLIGTLAAGDGITLQARTMFNERFEIHIIG